MASERAVALITGAARRIGAQIAQRLHADGYDLVLHYQHSQAQMQALLDVLNAARPGSAIGVCADLGDCARLPALVAQAADRYGRLDALVNNASAFFATPLGSVRPEQWNAMFDVNARAPFFLAQAAAPHLRATRGAIVNLGDVYARRPRADLAVYAASKAALEGLTRALAQTLGPHVRVNAVAPGAILWPETGGDPEAQARLIARTPLGRSGTPADIAGAVAWLLSPASSYVTGMVLRVDGGREA